jgi:hypothetical protein
MCSNSNQQKNICSCQEYFINNPAFWSKKKKISLLEEHLECLQNQITETNESLEELRK